MREIVIAEEFVAKPDGAGQFLHGEIHHVTRWPAVGTGAMYTPVAKYFVWPGVAAPEVLRPHWRIDCVLREHHLAPAPDWLGRRLADAMMLHGIVREPLAVTWQIATAVGSESRGPIWDGDDGED
ncbi:hypothetical protein G3576_07410 [Roseomonas stagni]|uniref:Uncharacterized protein n=1 Tax=Falsiroseomonas algicola TaxID=2716930 RepID=A0A6M1LHJ7_9PROT|nr:hypothetical protein [Falsiroseomonas algicola]NGM19838.1 hypothetical protein [Falsiroseomonas algicola]